MYAGIDKTIGLFMGLFTYRLLSFRHCHLWGRSDTREGPQKEWRKLSIHRQDQTDKTTKNLISLSGKINSGQAKKKTSGFVAERTKETQIMCLNNRKDRTMEATMTQQAI